MTEERVMFEGKCGQDGTTCGPWCRRAHARVRRKRVVNHE